MQQAHKYARIERERRFLVDRIPENFPAVRIRQITDRYIVGTTLRLRKLQDNGGPRIFKLTQKISQRGPGAQQGFITSMYLAENEYNLLAQLPAKVIHKSRHSVPPFGIDIFQGELEGLLLAEAEFDSALDAENLALPSFILIEVSSDERFTGGCLAHASRETIQTWLFEYGINLQVS